MTALLPYMLAGHQDRAGDAAEAGGGKAEHQAHQKKAPHNYHWQLFLSTDNQCEYCQGQGVGFVGQYVIFIGHHGVLP